MHIDYSGLVTFYDTSLSSLVESHYGKDRFHLCLDVNSVQQLEQVRAELHAVLSCWKDRESGTDWGSITRVVMERYARRLEYLCSLLSLNTTFVDALERAAIAHIQLLVMLLLYITTADIPKQLPASADRKVHHGRRITQVWGTPPSQPKPAS